MGPAIYRMTIAGLMGGLLTSYWIVHNNRIETIKQKDLNNDGRPDLVLETKGGDRGIWLAQEDGTYKRFEDVQKEWRAQATSESQQAVKSIDTKIAEIIAKANELR